MSRENMTALTGALGEAIGIPELELDENDYCCLMLEDGPTINLEYFEENDLLVLFSFLGVVDKAKRPGVHEMMLRGNFFWQGSGGSTLCVEEETDGAVLMGQIAVSDLEFPELYAVIEAFAERAEDWTARIAEFTPENVGPTDSRPPPMAGPDPTALA